MFEDILFPTDGSDGAARAFEHALDVAAAHGATVHVLNVADTTRDSLVRIEGQIVDALVEEGEALVEEVAALADDRNVPTETAVLQGEPYRAIVDYADDRGIDLVVMPTHGRRGLSRLLLGSTTERVVRRSNVPVLTLRPDADVDHPYPYGRVLVPTDGSDCAAAALDLGAGLATTGGATLHVLSVLDIAQYGIDTRVDVQLDRLEAASEAAVDEATARAEAAGVDPESLVGAVEVSSSIHRAIMSYVEDHDVDAVVVGTHGRTGFHRYMLGSVAEKLVRTAPVPVLTVREAATGE